MNKSGLADSPLFSPTQKRKAIFQSDEDSNPPNAKRPLHTKKKKLKKAPTIKDDVKTPRPHDTNQETMVSRYHDTVIELIRKTVKEFGKESATHRFTIEEKKAIADIIYSYKRQGVRTSENELTRVAINFIIQDYRENGKNSLLDKVLRALNE